MQVLDYYPYGEKRIDEQYTDFSEDHQFTGHLFDEDTELLYAGARYYPGEIGRWISQDPLYLQLGVLDNSDQKEAKKELDEFLSSPQKLNSYSYTSNNPLIHIDPTGKAEVYIREAGPINANSLEPVQQGGHVLIRVDHKYYGFAPTGDQSSDVQRYNEKQFQDEYKGQTWQIVNIGTKWDDQIVSQFESLRQQGQSIPETTYSFWKNNCSQKAWDILSDVGAFDNRIPMPKTFAPDQMSKQFQYYQKAEKVIKFFNNSYNPLIKSIIKDYKVGR